MMKRSTAPASVRTSFRKTMGVGICSLVALAASACGGSEATVTATDVAVTSSQADTAETSAPAAAEPEAPVESESAEEADAPAEAVDTDTASLGVSQGSFELTLANGESFSVPVGCALMPQVSAGQEILYSATGQADGLIVDVTAWGETEFDFSDSVEVTDATTYDTMWRSVASTDLVVELNGNVITATGGFYQGENLNGERTPGELTVTC